VCSSDLAVQPDWTNRRGQTEILARVDDKDRLHLSDKGMYWEYGGSWGKVGLHDGYWPTVVNGIYWWPKWADEKHTEPLAAPELWPKALNKFQLVQVVAKRGKVEVTEKGPPEVVLSFGDQGLGSSQVGCLIATGNVPRAGEAAGKR